MSPEQKRIQIAEACGWKPGENKKWVDGQGFGIPPGGEDWHWEQLPNYFSDLNAMHDATVAVIHVDAFTRRRYYKTLDKITGDQWNTIDATAAQRAEAFGLTLGLWKEGE